MDKFVFEDAVKNDFGNGPAWSDVEKNDFGNGPNWSDTIDYSKSDPLPDWPGDDPTDAMSIEGIEYDKSTGNEAIEGVEYGADDFNSVIDPILGLGASFTPVDDGYF